MVCTVEHQSRLLFITFAVQWNHTLPALMVPQNLPPPASSTPVKAFNTQWQSTFTVDTLWHFQQQIKMLPLHKKQARVHVWICGLPKMHRGIIILGLRGNNFVFCMFFVCRKSPKQFGVFWPFKEELTHIFKVAETPPQARFDAGGEHQKQ